MEDFCRLILSLVDWVMERILSMIILVPRSLRYKVASSHIAIIPVGRLEPREALISSRAVAIKSKVAMKAQQ
jgi:hypothetical protein